MSDVALRGGSFGDVLLGGGQSFLVGGVTGGLGRKLNIQSLPGKVGFGTGLSGALSYVGGADNEEVYRQMLLGGATTLGSHMGPRLQTGPGAQSGPLFRSRWLRNQINAGVSSVVMGAHESGAFGTQITGSVPNEPNIQLYDAKGRPLSVSQPEGTGPVSPPQGNWKSVQIGGELPSPYNFELPPVRITRRRLLPIDIGHRGCVSQQPPDITTFRSAPARR
jgi:hypothetical protein